eukprot:6193183-Pleurochrysis_carterae.AAC.2
MLELASCCGAAVPRAASRCSRSIAALAWPRASAACVAARAFIASRCSSLLLITMPMRCRSSKPPRCGCAGERTAIMLGRPRCARADSGGGGKIGSPPLTMVSDVCCCLRDTRTLPATQGTAQKSGRMGLTTRSSVAREETPRRMRLQAERESGLRRCDGDAEEEEAALGQPVPLVIPPRQRAQHLEVEPRGHEQQVQRERACQRRRRVGGRRRRAAAARGATRRSSRLHRPIARAPAASHGRENVRLRELERVDSEGRRGGDHAAYDASAQEHVQVRAALVVERVADKEAVAAELRRADDDQAKDRPRWPCARAASSNDANQQREDRHAREDDQVDAELRELHRLLVLRSQVQASAPRNKGGR